MRLLKLVEGDFAGKYYVPMDWHEKIVRDIYDNVDGSGNRKIREAYISVPRKNSKTTFVAALCLYHLFADGEIGGQIYLAASDREQAKLAFKILTAMIRQQPTLKRLCQISKNGTVEVPSTNSRLRVLSKLSENVHGTNPSFVIYDELHVAKNRDMYDALITGMGNRRQPLLCIVTTAGNDRKSICYEKYHYGKQILAGTLTNDSFYAYIREPEEGDNWHDPAVWQKVNPGWGISVDPVFIENQHRQACDVPSFENTFRQLYLNEWVSQSTRWIKMDVWDKAQVNASPSDFADMPCYCGLDLSTTRDLTCFVMCFAADGKYYLFPHFFIPSDTVEISVNKVAYEAWTRSGQLFSTPGNVVDYDFLADHIAGLARQYNIKAVAYDRWNSNYIAQRLEARGIEMLAYSQGFRNLSPASKDFERGLVCGEIFHDNNEVFRWCADNVEVLSDSNGNIRPTKPSEDSKIDGIVASIMAFDLARQKAGSGSVYESSGLVVL